MRSCFETCARSLRVPSKAFAGLVLLGLAVFSVTLAILSFRIFLAGIASAERDAACHFVPAVQLEIGIHLVELSADSGGSFRDLGEDGGKRFRAELVSREEDPLWGRSAFCLERPQTEPMAIASFRSGAIRATYREYAQSLGFPGLFYRVEFMQGAALPYVAAPVSNPAGASEMTEHLVRRRNSRRIELTMRGINNEGFRSRAFCNFVPRLFETKIPGWKCNFYVEDYRTDLRYTFGFAVFEQEELDPDDVRDTSLKVGRNLRELLKDLAPKNPLPLTSQQDL